MKKSFFEGMSSWTQLLFLMLFILLSLFILGAIIAVCQKTSPELVTSVSFLRFSIVLQSVGVFLLPALFCVYLFQKHPIQFLRVNRKMNFSFLALSIILIIAVQPIVSLLGYYNNEMSLPPSLAGLESQMRLWEDTAKKAMEMLIISDSKTVLMLNILAIAVAAGITEEVFFRGLLQQLFYKITSNQHIAVWVTAIIFSAIHFQFYGFFPRLFLGALLGYLFVWSGNLWVPIIVHAVNNAISVLLFRYYYDTPMYDKLEHIGVGETWWTSLVSLVVVVLICWLLTKMYKESNLADEDEIVKTDI